jgi:hypothetical protein
MLMKSRLLMAGLPLILLACSDSPSEVATSVLVSVTPADGAVDLGTAPTIEVLFDGPVAPGATMVIALQRGDCPGPVVEGTWSRSADGRTLRFAPMSALEPGTRYTIHVGGGMTDPNGSRVDLETHGPGLGGMWVTETMVMGMGSMGMGMLSHSGPGWRHANGFYGLAFDFTTAAGG